MPHTTKTTRDETRRWAEGWKRVNAFQLEELRRRTPEECLQHFVALLEMAKAMNWERHTPEQIDAVRQRWKKLKGYGG